MSNLSDSTDVLLANSSVKWGMGGGAATSIFGGLSGNDLLVLIGTSVTILGFLVNLVFQYKRNKRAEEEHRLRAQLLKTQIKNAEESSRN